MLHIKVKEIMKPKIAFCFSGIPRGVNPFDFLNRFKNDYSIYTFIHAWEKEDILNDHISNKAHVMNDIIFENCKSISDDFEIVKEKFSEKIEFFTKIFNSINKEKIVIRKTLSVISMFYGIKQVQVMRKYYEMKNNIIFDCVFRCRFENCWKTNEKFNLNEFDLNYIWLPGRMKWPICDHLAFSSSHNMDYYSNVFDNIIELANKIEYWPEKMLEEHLSKKTIKEMQLFASCGGYLWD